MRGRLKKIKIIIPLGGLEVFFPIESIGWTEPISTDIELLRPVPRAKNWSGYLIGFELVEKNKPSSSPHELIYRRTWGLPLSSGSYQRR